MDDLALEGPVIRLCAQSGSHRIQPHILPFFCVAFLTTQEVIEKAFLPVWFWHSECKDSFAKDAAQALHPSLQQDSINWQMDEQMHMIRHQHITAYRHIELCLCAFAKRSKGLMDFHARQKVHPPPGVEGNEIEWGDVVEKPIQPRWPERKLWRHRESVSGLRQTPQRVVAAVLCRL